MPQIVPPEYTRQILFSLTAEGHSAYLVGGCVRDMLMGKTPQDWDICTSALPQEVLDIFPNAVPTGLKHGTVTVYCGGKSAEVTTFRTDGAYPDHRRPESVTFVSDIESDLSRRDFTMNAIACSYDGCCVDLFGGRDDIDARIIRCVGEPEKRFAEDALRMLRALRFASRLGFEIEKNTYASIGSCAYLCSSLAPERIADELKKILMSGRTEILDEVMKLGLISHLTDGAGKPGAPFAAVADMPENASYRWTGFAVMLNKYGYVSSARGFLSSLKLDTATLRYCGQTEKILSLLPTANAACMKRLLAEYGEDCVICAAAVKKALGTDCENELFRVLDSGECHSLKSLAVCGDDLKSLGYSGKRLGAVLKLLLEHVIEHPGDNDRGILLKLAENTEVNDVIL